MSLTGRDCARPRGVARTMRTRHANGLLLAAFVLCLCAGVGRASERGGTVTFAVDLNAPTDARTVKLWFPYPTSNADQTIRDLTFRGNYSSFVLSQEPASGAVYLYAEWNGPMDKRTLKIEFHARARERKMARLADKQETLPQDARRYLEPGAWIPSRDPQVSSLARRITAGRTGILARARAVYDWVVENTRRDPAVRGCGTGNVPVTLAARSGKCVDISSVYVALARAAGVPAREIFGLRLGRNAESDITNSHHCWAEFYLPGTGWVPVDPADVVKATLENNLDPAGARPYRDYYFGSVDEFRIALQRGGRGLAFSEGNAERVNYFMYPYAEVDGKPLDFLAPDAFRYSIRFTED